MGSRATKFIVIKSFKFIILVLSHSNSISTYDCSSRCYVMNTFNTHFTEYCLQNKLSLVIFVKISKQIRINGLKICYL